MEKENNLVRVEGEDGKTFDMLILNEFEHKNKKYAILSEIDHCHCDEDCNCDEDCDCGCQEGKECTCEGECHCGCHNECDEDCDCGCQEGKECTCEGECHCDDEPIVCLLEITKDKDGNEIFKSIDDEKLFNELVEKADKILYKD